MTVPDEPPSDDLEERRAWVEQQRRPRSVGTRGRRAAITTARRGRVLPDHGEAWSDRTIASRALHRVGELTAQATTGVLVAAIVMAWTVVGEFTGFPDWWQLVLFSAGTSVTLVMVFAIQHTQSRQETAIQRKLDELLRALPNADNRLIAAEDAPDDELDALAQLNLADREGRAPKT